MDGVVASVNYATEKASVSFSGSIVPSDLIATVEATGYTAELPSPEPVTSDPHAAEVGSYRRPVIVLGMVPAWQFTGWQWASLVLATPVVTWCAWPFHRATFANLRHGATTMDTLVSLGVLAAYGWSLYALFLGTAGALGMTHPFELTMARSDGTGNVYFETAAGVTTFLLAGR